MLLTSFPVYFVLIALVFSHSCLCYSGMLSIGYFFGALMFASSEAKFLDNAAFVILTQPSPFHQYVSQLSKVKICAQLNAMRRGRDLIMIAPYDFNHVPGYWLITPLFRKLLEIEDLSWVVFLDERTRVNASKLFQVLSTYDEKKENFIGLGLKDEHPTIIHHFNPAGHLVYPDFMAGFVLSVPVLKKSLHKWSIVGKSGFAIDPKYELAKVLRNHINGLELTVDKHFCVSKEKDCATWVEVNYPKCKTIYTKKNIIFAVKTCQQFHKDRIKIIKSTWAREQEGLKVMFFSDYEDPSIPTKDLGVQNVDFGHCEKTMSIISYINATMDEDVKFVAVVDDDTLISVPRLLKLLSCYEYTDPFGLGDRYGYNLTGYGYDYVTGGGGMVFSISAIHLIADSCSESCPERSTPDDMLLGICLRELGIPVVHSSHFHQGRPEDYPAAFLKHHEPVSFHKYWRTDPYKIYNEYLKVPQNEQKHLHGEL